MISLVAAVCSALCACVWVRCIPPGRDRQRAALALVWAFVAGLQFVAAALSLSKHETAAPPQAEASEPPGPP